MGALNNLCGIQILSIVSPAEYMCCVCIDFDFGAFGWRVAFVFTCCFEIS